MRDAGGFARSARALADDPVQEVIRNDPPRDFAGTAVGLNDRSVRFWSEVGTSSIWISTWGLDESVVRGLESGWQEQVKTALEA